MTTRKRDRELSDEEVICLADWTLIPDLHMSQIQLAGSPSIRIPRENPRCECVEWCFFLGVGMLSRCSI